MTKKLKMQVHALNKMKISGSLLCVSLLLGGLLGCGDRYQVQMRKNTIMESQIVAESTVDAIEEKEGVINFAAATASSSQDSKTTVQVTRKRENINHSRLQTQGLLKAQGSSVDIMGYCDEIFGFGISSSRECASLEGYFRIKIHAVSDLQVLRISLYAARVTSAQLQRGGSIPLSRVFFMNDPVKVPGSNQVNTDSILTFNRGLIPGGDFLILMSMQVQKPDGTVAVLSSDVRGTLVSVLPLPQITIENVTLADGMPYHPGTTILPAQLGLTFSYKINSYSALERSRYETKVKFFINDSTDPVYEDVIVNDHAAITLGHNTVKYAGRNNGQVTLRIVAELTLLDFDSEFQQTLNPVGSLLPSGQFLKYQKIGSSNISIPFRLQ